MTALQDEKMARHPKPAVQSLTGDEKGANGDSTVAPPPEDDVSDDSIEDIRDAFSSPRYAVGEASSPISSLTIESSVAAKAKIVKKKKAWRLEPIPTIKYVPVPQQEKMR